MPIGVGMLVPAAVPFAPVDVAAPLVVVPAAAAPLVVVLFVPVLFVLVLFVLVPFVAVLFVVALPFAVPVEPVPLVAELLWPRSVPLMAGLPSTD